MAPLRTIADSFFTFKGEDGIYINARRGETVEVPEGEDLERGDKFGAFTAEVGDEPPAPAETTVVNIDPAWSDAEYDAFVDVAHTDEVMERLGLFLNEDDRAIVAGKVLAAEERGKNRKGLIAELHKVIGVNEPVVVDPDVEAILAGSVDEVLAAAVSQPDLIPALVAAEEAGKKRKGILEGLKTDA